MVYHARKEAEIEGDPLYNPNRHAMLMKLRWDEDGRPVFSYNRLTRRYAIWQNLIINENNRIRYESNLKFTVIFQSTSEDVSMREFMWEKILTYPM